MALYSERKLPVLLGHDYNHVMADASIDVEGTEVTITIAAKGKEGRALVELLSANEIVALSFAGVPIQPHTPKEKM